MTKQAAKMRHRRNRLIDQDIPTGRDVKVKEVQREQGRLDRLYFEMFADAKNGDVWRDLQARFGPMRAPTCKDDGGRVDPLATAERNGEANVIRWIMNAMARGNDPKRNDDG